MYIHFNDFLALHHASVPLIVIASLLTGHALTFTVKLGTGFVVSLLILYAADVAHVHHVSNILILKSVVVFAAGVNAGVVNDVHTVSLHVLHPFVEYCTFVLGDGVAVSVAVHVIVHP